MTLCELVVNAHHVLLHSETAVMSDKIHMSYRLWVLPETPNFSRVFSSCFIDNFGVICVSLKTLHCNDMTYCVESISVNSFSKISIYFVVFCRHSDLG